MIDMLDLAPLPSEIERPRARLARFLDEEVRAAEREARVGDEADAPPELARWVATRSVELGLYRLLQPAELGGGGLGPLGGVALHEAIGASGCVLGHLAVGGDGGLLRHADAGLRPRFLEPVLRGEMTAALAFTDAREGPRTTAVRRGEAFLVSGVKSFVSGGARTDLLLTVATVTDNPGGATGTAVFVIPRARSGVTLRRELRTLDGALHGEFALDGVEVPAGDMIGKLGQGLPRALERSAPAAPERGAPGRSRAGAGHARRERHRSLYGAGGSLRGGRPSRGGARCRDGGRHR